MKKFIRLLLYLLFIFLWVIVIVLSLELFERLRWKYIEKTNKYIRIRRGEILYTEWDPDSKPEVVQYGEGKNIFSPSDLMVGDSFCLPELSDFEKWTYRLAYYISGDEVLKQCMKTIYSITECEVNRSSESLTISVLGCKNGYGEDAINKLNKLIGKVDPKSLVDNRLLWRIYDESEHRESLIYFFPSVSPGRNYFYRCFIIPSTLSNDSLTSLAGNTFLDVIYEVPYFSYLPHQSSTKNPFRTNNFGFRDYDFIVPKPKGNIRILCIGASTTEEGISNKETYPKFLEEILRKHFSTERIEVFNCGISGMTLRKHIAKLPDYFLLEPDIVIIYEGVNDIIFELLVNRYHNLSHVIRKLISNFYIFSFIFRNRFPLAYSRNDLLNDIEQSMLPNLETLISQFSMEGKILVLSSIGAPRIDFLTKEVREYMEYYYWKEWGGIYSTFQQYCEVISMWNEILRDYCEKENLIYVPFAEKIPSSIEYFGDICHLRQKGIKLKAEIMAEVLIPVIEELLKDNKQ